jgi:hypothetical protein
LNRKGDIMKYTFEIDNRPGTLIELEKKALSSKYKVYINGIEAQMLNKKQRIYNLKFNDGTSDAIKINPKFLGLNVEGVIDNKKIQITPPLAWYEYILCLLPAILLSGGALGAVIGLEI